jgi:hypothetical protein
MAAIQESAFTPELNRKGGTNGACVKSTAVFKPNKFKIFNGSLPIPKFFLVSQSAAERFRE